MPKSILITGCSSGIGLCAAQRLKDRGYQVFATARKPANVDMLKAKGLTAMQLDVDDPASMQRCLDRVLQATNGTLDALFNNAGIIVPGAIEDVSPDMIQTQFRTNVFGPVALIRMVLPIMYRQGHGRIIQNSSILGIVTLPYTGVYSASKFALEGFSNALRQEVRKANIFVASIVPGPVKSKLRDHSFEFYKQLDSAHSRNAEVYKKMEEKYFHPPTRDNFYTNDPDAVVAKLIHALESKRPRAHYYVGFIAHAFAFLRRILPDSALGWVTTNIR